MSQTSVLAPDIAALSFERTVNRRAVHRWALSEVFLTDVQPAGPDEFHAAAQLPTSHVYYRDHTGPAHTVDGILLMECCRQAATWIAHEHLGVAQGSYFLVSEWTSRLHGPPRTGAQPGRLRLRLRVDRGLVRDGVVRAARFDVRLFLDEVFAGTMTIAVRYIPAEEAPAVREYHRGTPPPLSTTLPEPAGIPVAPHAVGRRDPANVVLYDARSDGNPVRARLATNPAHPSFFDHPQDHYTAMILFEAARQLAFLSLPDGLRGQAWISGYRARFTRFAELDSPVIAETGQARGTPAAAELTVPVVFRQDASEISVVAVSVLGLGEGEDR